MAEVCCDGTHPAEGHYDFTGVCRNGQHENCGFFLRAATGYHWWCACKCHPEPKEVWGTMSSERALATFRAARGQ